MRETICEYFNPDVEILSVGYSSDSDHLFFKITTEADVDMTDSTFGVLVNDVSNTGQTHELACASWTTASAASIRGYTYVWADGAWEAQDNGVDREPNIRVNTASFSGVELACEKADIGFTIDESNDKIMAISSDAGRKLFAVTWNEENTPSTSIDDSTTSTTIPEFSSLLMPIASIILIVGYNNRLKRKYSNQH